MNRRIDPEKVDYWTWAWRRIRCLKAVAKAMPHSWNHELEQIVDTGYCLDRHLNHEYK